MTAIPRNAAATTGKAVPTVAADRGMLRGLSFRDKATATTPGQRERSVTVWTAGDSVRAGYWECETGTFTAVREGEHEICYIASGSASLHDANGTVTPIGPGTVLVLPAGWQGSWEIHEPLEKMFVVVSG